MAALLNFNLIVRVIGVKTLVVVIALFQRLIDVIALLDLFGRQLLVESLLFYLLLHLSGKGAPRELDGHSAFVHDLKVLVGEQRDRGRIGVNVRLGKVHVVVVRFAENLNIGFESFVGQAQFFDVLLGFLRNEVEDELLALADFENSFVLVEFEVRRHRNVPLGSLFSDVADHDGLFGLELYGHEAEVKLVWEIKHGSATAGADWHNELLAFSNNSEIVCVVDFCFGAEFDDVADFHAGRHFRSHLVDVRCHRACGLACLLCCHHALLRGSDCKELGIGGNNLNRSRDSVFIPK